MQLTERESLTGTYSVEVSGWDTSHSFFVEKSELCWYEENGKQLSLSRQLSAGAMVFVRLLRPTEPEPSFPVAYQVEPLFTMSGRPQKFRITRIAPRNVWKQDL